MATLETARHRHIVHFDEEEKCCGDMQVIMQRPTKADSWQT